MFAPSKSFSILIALGSVIAVIVESTHPGFAPAYAWHSRRGNRREIMRARRPPQRFAGSREARWYPARCESDLRRIPGPEAWPASALNQHRSTLMQPFPKA